MRDVDTSAGPVPRHFWWIAAGLAACSGFAGAAAGAGMAANHHDDSCLAVVENALDSVLGTPSAPREWRWNPPAVTFDGMWMDDR